MSNKKLSQKISFCGLTCALAIVLMMFFAMIGVGQYAGPFVATVLLIIVIEEYGAKTALVCYGAISLLGLMVLPDRELALFFVCLGWYPSALEYINKIPVLVVRIAIKLAIYAAIIFVMYKVMAVLFGFAEVLTEELVYFYGFMFVLGAGVFLILDKAYDSSRIKWHTRWRKNFKRMI